MRRSDHESGKFLDTHECKRKKKANLQPKMTTHAKTNSIHNNSKEAHLQKTDKAIQRKSETFVTSKLNVKNWEESKFRSYWALLMCKKRREREKQ